MNRVYVSTPINGRKEATFEMKRRAAYERCEEISKRVKRMLDDECVIRTPFSAVKLEERVGEPEALGRCITKLLRCDMVVMDTGWTKSKGCLLEYTAARLYGKPIMFYEVDTEREVVDE